MKGTNLGELEELVLLVVGVLFDEAYGVAIQNELQERCDRKGTLSTIHVALHRLEEKGFLESRFDGATNERGGRRKLLFRVTKCAMNYGKVFQPLAFRYERSVTRLD